MVKYYYDKYNVIPSERYDDTAPWEPYNDFIATFYELKKSYWFNSSSNEYSVSGGEWGRDTPIPVGTIGYELSGNLLRKITALESTPHGGDVRSTVHVKIPSYNSSTTIYNKGSLVQSNIAVEEGTYPANGQHTDGCWYVKGTAVNTAPTQPGAFTQPSGTLEIGDSKVISWGASTDVNNNLSKYILEVAINNGSWTQIGTPASNSFSYKIQTAASIKFRVKAQDSEGLESAYRESNLYTVTNPKYYWSKYNVITTPSKQENYILDYSGYSPTVKNFTSISDYIYARSSINGSYTGIGASGNSIDGFTISCWGSFNVSSLTPNSTFTVYTPYFSSPNLPRKFVLVVSSTGAVTESDYYKGQVKGTGVYGPPSISKGALISSNIVAELNTYTSDAKNTDGYWYVRGSRVNQSIDPPSPFTEPVSSKKFKPGEITNITFGASNAPNLSLYEVDYRYNTTGTWTQLAYNNTLTRSLTITTDKSLKTLELRVRAKNTSNVYSDYVYSEAFVIEHNVAPTVTLTGPSDNATLYENDTLTISGTAFDADPDQSVTAYYQINSEPRKVLATNLSQTQIALSKQLTFKGGKLYDGEMPITGSLADGVAHTLKVWAEDSEKASSAIIERTFYVVPNRAPLLSVDAVVPSGVVDADKFKISGTASDQDANSTVKVTRRINAGNAVEIYSGAGGAWEFELALSQLVVGQNTIVIEVIDNYGAKASKTVTLNKKEVKTPILQSVARYKIEPPKDSAKGVLLFIQRDEELDVKVELSMTLSSEQEQYETLTPVNTAPVQQGVVEDTFEHEGLEAKQNIILKITPSRTDLSFNHKIHLISGAVD